MPVLLHMQGCHCCTLFSINCSICSVNIDDIAMLGKWNSDHMVKSYVNGIPLAAVLARAGFQDYFHMSPRTTVKPTDELLAEIFPGVVNQF